AVRATPPAESSLKSAADAASQVDYATTVALQASERARARNNSRDFESGLERAAIGLAARHKQLSEAHRLSQALGQLAKQQQSAVDAIDTARDQLESPAETEDTEREEQLRRQAAQSMRSATRQFAETQKETGEAASQ